MHKKELIDETFDIDRSESSYELSIQASLDGFSFCVKDSVRNSFIALVSYPFAKPVEDDGDWAGLIADFFAQYDYISRKYKSICLSFSSGNFVLIPSTLFVPEKAKQLYELTHVLPELHELHFRQVEDAGMTIVFALPSTFCSHWLFRQPNTRFIPQVAPLIARGLARNDKSGPLIIVDFTQMAFYLLVFAGGKLIHCNHIKHVSPEDTAYHIVNTCKQLSVDTLQTEISVVGANNDEPTLVSLLSRFFSRVNSDAGYDSRHFSYQLSRYRKEYYNLFNLSQCGS
jgi:hypothetical protein